MFYKMKATKSSISNELFIPYSTISRIINESKKDYKANIDSLEIEWEKKRQAKTYSKYASNYIENEKDAFFSKDVQMYLKSEYELNLSSSSIIQHMKSNHNLSFKRVSSRPIFIDFYHIQRLKLLIAVEFSNLVDNSKILINMMRPVSREQER